MDPATDADRLDDLFDDERQPPTPLEHRLLRLRALEPRSTRDAEIAAEGARLLAELRSIVDQTVILEARLEDLSQYAPLRGLTLAEAALVVLREWGFPMHVGLLGDRLYARGWRHPRPPSLRRDRIGTQLAVRLAQLPNTFVRVRPNTFGLVEWEEMDP